MDHSVIRMVVNDPRKAIAIFEEHGTLVVEDDVLMLEGDNKAALLAKIAHKLADAKINIEYCYCATSPNAKKGLMIMRCSNAQKALKVLNMKLNRAGCPDMTARMRSARFRHAK